MNQPATTLRPRDFALLLLASGDLRPRQRARDQQADLAGLELKRRVLEQVAAMDPEPDDLPGVLVSIIDQIGPPSGPTRAIAAMIVEDWQAASAAPECVAHLLAEATRINAPERRRGA